VIAAFAEDEYDLPPPECRDPRPRPCTSPSHRWSRWEGQDAEPDRLWAVDPKADGEAPATLVRVALFGDAVGTIARGLPRAPRLYC
jgi:hypothetical protein